MRQGIGGAALLARDAAQLIMSVGLGGIDLYRLLEALDRLRITAALLVDQSKLVLRIAIVRIDGGGLQHFMKVLPVAQPRSQVAQLAAQKVPGVEQEEWRSQVP